MRFDRLLAVALVAAAPVAHAASDGALLDYRNEAFVLALPDTAEAERPRIAETLAAGGGETAKALGKDFVVLGSAEGRFRGAAARAYLVAASAPVAIDPFAQGPAPVIVILPGDGPGQVYLLPGDSAYQRLVAAADTDGDGSDELFLETSAFNMGQSVTGLDIVAFGADGAARVTERLDEVAFDGCENPAGERRRTASTVSVGPDGVTTEDHDLGCAR